MKGMKKCVPDLIIGTLLLLFLVSLSAQMSVIPKDSRSYPLILMILSYIMVSVLVLQSLFQLKNSPVVESRLKEQVKIILPYAAVILVYLFFLDKIGYIIDTFLFSMTSLIYLRLKNKALMVILSVVLTLSLYFIFTRFLSVILPRGSIISVSF